MIGGLLPGGTSDNNHPYVAYITEPVVTPDYPQLALDNLKHTSDISLNRVSI